MKAGRVLFLFLIIMGSVILFGGRGVLDNARLGQKIRDLQQQNADFTARNDALKREILLLRNDMRYIEKIARDELGMVRQKDMIYRRVD